MATNLSVIILLFEMALYLTTVISVFLYSEFEPIAKGVEIAMKQMDLPEIMKDAFSNNYINVGDYSNSFIELLDSYSTMSGSPIRFNEKEKLLLTFSSTEDPIEYKVSTQLKYYRKMQEVQCTDFFILHYNLFHAQWNIQGVIQHVYNMMKIGYLGNLFVYKWLLKLHINLLTSPDSKDEAWILQTNGDSVYFDPEQYKTTLDELVIMCVKHNYLENDNSEGFFNKVSEHDKFNTQLHLDFNTNISPLPFFFDYLYLSNIRQCIQPIVPITSVTTGWNIINNIFLNEIDGVNAHLTTVEDWIRDPLKNIVFQQMFLIIVRLKQYCFVKVVLMAYQKMDVSKYKYRLDIFYRLDYFISLISDTVEYIQFEENKLDEVLTLLGNYKKGEPNYEENEKLLKIITNEITDSVKTIGIPVDTELACITDDDLKTELAFNIYLGNLEKAFLEFRNFLQTTLDGYSINFLMFFVDGANYTELAVFP